MYHVITSCPVGLGGALLPARQSKLRKRFWLPSLSTLQNSIKQKHTHTLPSMNKLAISESLTLLNYQMLDPTHTLTMSSLVNYFGE